MLKHSTKRLSNHDQLDEDKADSRPFSNRPGPLVSAPAVRIASPGKPKAIRHSRLIGSADPPILPLTRAAL